MDVVRQARDALVSHLKVLLRARERLIQAEAANPGYPATTEPSSSISNVDDDEPVPMVTGRRDRPDGEDLLYPPLDGDATFDERPEEDPIIRHQDVAAEYNSMDYGQPYRDYISGSAATMISGEEPANNNNVVDSLHAHDAAAGSSEFNDDFYPLEDGEPGDAIQWYQQLYNPDDEQLQLLRHLLLPPATEDDDELLSFELYGDEEASADEDRDIRRAIDAGRLLVPRIVDATPAVLMSEESRGGFGGVPASAAAIAGLRKQKYDGSGGDTSCVICMRDYKKGKRLLVVPCRYSHRFHGKCLRKWLSRSHLCPLCRHALPTVEDATV